MEDKMAVGRTHKSKLIEGWLS